MTKLRLGINIDHVATVRNARNISPRPLWEGARREATRGRGMVQQALPQMHHAARDAFAPSRKGRGEYLR
jgi:pyridoxine 5'-phosphate synthase PdxJ